MNKFILIDGHSILNRAFYGVPLLTVSGGLPTNAILGFLNIFFKILDERHPNYLAIAFDVHQPTFRHQMYQEYKGTRKGMPEELKQQIPIIKELLEKMNITIVELPGYEADDIIGTLSLRGEEEGMNVEVISGDRDLLQLASEKVTICIPKTKKGTTTVEHYDAKAVREMYKVTPKEFIDVKALMGDSSDNIPGVPGIGEKGATAIIAQFGSIENAYERAKEIPNLRNRNAFLEHYDMAVMSKMLATIDRYAPIDISLESCTLTDIYTPQAFELIKKLELKSMISRFDGVVAENDFESGFTHISDRDEADAIFVRAMEAEEIGLSIFKETFFSVALCLDGKQTYFMSETESVTKTYLTQEIQHLITQKKQISVMSVKENNDILQSDESHHLFDISLAAYLINPMQNHYDYDDIARDFLSLTVPSYAEIFPKVKKGELSSEEILENILKYTCYEAYVTFKSHMVLSERLKDLQMYNLYKDIELPLTYCLYEMEREGIQVEADRLKEYGEKLQKGIQSLEQDIYDEAGCEFNINSPKQLGGILFDQMKLPGGKKTKIGYSTSASVLEKLESDYPFVGKILEYRQLTKLKSTYADGLSTYIREDGRIHGKFHQTITSTGRISSAEPNLQNIPVRMPLGREIRKIFVPKDDCVFVDADYSQIELRLLAHLSHDKNLIDAYANSKDIHTATASLVFKTPIDQVTKEQRSNAKAVNFGIVYGISSFGLSKGLSISRKEAEQYISDYFESYPGIKEYLDDAVKSAKKQGYSVTMFHRRRPIPELSSGNFMQKQFGERVAMNAPIQGTAADIMKIAMIQVAREIKKRHLTSKIVLQIHDELLIETPKDEIEDIKEILVRNMSGAAKLLVPLEIDVGVGHNWDEAHG